MFQGLVKAMSDELSAAGLGRRISSHVKARPPNAHLPQPEKLGTTRYQWSTLPLYSQAESQRCIPSSSMAEKASVERSNDTRHWAN